MTVTLRELIIYAATMSVMAFLTWFIYLITSGPTACWIGLAIGWITSIVFQDLRRISQ